MKVSSNLLILALVLIAAGCSKKKDATTTPPVSTSSKLYYFRYTFNGVTDTIEANNSRAYTSATAAVIGSVYPDIGGIPVISLQFGPYNSHDTLTESDVLSLAGRTLYFSDTVMGPHLGYEVSYSSGTINSVATTDTTYNVKVSSVSFLRVDSSQQYPARMYVIAGTCKALMGQWVGDGVPLTGEFKMVITRTIY